MYEIHHQNGQPHTEQTGLPKDGAFGTEAGDVAFHDGNLNNTLQYDGKQWVLHPGARCLRCNKLHKLL